ncbi:MAG: hypothetical protein KBC42_03580 [Candidatus Pacebacteria bacterium]|nr:hypothetical protein [Candidatus Paceibacterota bacterium]MBP9780977.1 hypothetical protein [Candidatus Paceibacterota bacterium]
MAKRAIEHVFTGTTVPYDSYDSSFTMMGDLIEQYSGASAEDNYIGPMTIGVGRPFETGTSIPSTYPHVISWVNKEGLYSTGTVAVSGTAVTGSGTGWLADGVPIGARIGFGSTNIAEITTWYTITAIDSATSLTLSASAGTIAGGTSFVINKEVKKDWVFLADIATAATTRRISCFVYDRLTSLFTWRGFITITYPTGGGVQTIRGMRVVYDTYTTGTAEVSGATVTGSGTTWSADRIAIGSRIGFGSTDPTQIATWYYINAVGSDTSLTLQSNITATGTGGTAANITVSAGTAYVIEDFKVLTSTTAAVIASAGLTLVNGLSYDDFVVGGTTISAATTVDKAKAAYSLVDLDSVYATGTVTVPGTTAVTGVGTAWTAALYLGCKIGFGSTTPSAITDWFTITAVGSTTGLTISSATTVPGGSAYVIVGGNGISCGLALDDRVNWTTQYAYIIELQAATTPQVYKYNFRTDLTTLGGIQGGKTASAWVLHTATQTVTGTVSQANNGRIGTLSHGPGSGIKCLYFASTTRIHRAPLTDIVQGSASWVSDSMTEVPTGGSGTYTLSSLLASVEIADQIDRLIVTSTGAGATTAHRRAYITKYDASGSYEFDHMFLADTGQQDQSAADNSSVPHPNPQGALLSVWSQAGLVYMVRTGTAATTNVMYTVPLGADWEYADGTVNQRLITPSMLTTNAEVLSRVYVSTAGYLGDAGLTMPTEPIRIYYRTSGIDDDSGAWTLVDKTGDLSAASPGANIQFAIEFRTIGALCLPNRVYSICCTYEDNTTDSHYQPSVGQSSISSKIFAWRFSTAFGGTVPALKIRLYNAETGALLLTDTTDAGVPLGSFQKSTNDGAAWGSYDSTDKLNETTYIRYTPTSLADNIKVRALLTQS